MLDRSVKTLLIMDEDKLVRDFLAEEYSYLNVNILKAKNSKDAWEIFETSNVDLALLPNQSNDIREPDLYKEIVSNNPNVSFIYISDSSAIDSDLKLNENVLGVIDFGVIQLKSMQEIVKKGLKI